jgi:hypothetical protein
VQLASKSAQLIAYGPIADSEGDPWNVKDEEGEWRLFVRSTVRRSEMNLMDYEFRRRFAYALQEKTDAHDKKLDKAEKFNSRLTAPALLNLLDLEGLVEVR